MEMFIPAVEKPQQAARAGCMEQSSYPSAWERLKTWESPPVPSLRESSSRGQETNAVTVTGQSDIVDTKLELYRTHQGPQFEMVLKMKSILFFARACGVHVCVCLDTHICAGAHMCIMCPGTLMTSDVFLNGYFLYWRNSSM